MATAAFIAGTALAVWLGVWVLFIGGIVDMIEGAKADPADGTRVGWGVLKTFVLAGPVGGAVFWISAWLAAMIGAPSKPKSRTTAKETERDFRRRVWKS